MIFIIIWIFVYFSKAYLIDYKNLKVIIICNKFSKNLKNLDKKFVNKVQIKY